LGRKLSYRHGSFYRTDDRSGFPTRAENTRKQWNGVWTDERFWEPRQPQDLVRGVPDLQNVPEARPKPQPVYTGPQSEEITASLAVGANLIPVENTIGLQAGHKVGIMLSTNQYFFTYILDFIGGLAVLLNPLPNTVPAANLITDFGPFDDPLDVRLLLQQNGHLFKLQQGGFLGIQ
jgi:hypothetical protein